LVRRTLHGTILGHFLLTRMQCGHFGYSLAITSYYCARFEPSRRSAISYFQQRSRKGESERERGRELIARIARSFVVDRVSRASPFPVCHRDFSAAMCVHSNNIPPSKIAPVYPARENSESSSRFDFVPRVSEVINFPDSIPPSETIAAVFPAILQSVNVTSR